MMKAYESKLETFVLLFQKISKIKKNGSLG